MKKKAWKSCLWELNKMNIQDKIDEIRKKPEHIRIRYVWMWVAICMVFIVTIWIISIIAQNKESESENNFSNKQFLEQFQSEKKSIEDSTSQIRNNFKQVQERQGNSGQ